MKLDQAATPGFARHESFHPRYGWFKKAVDGAAKDPEIFGKDEAVVTLGVGKNMVRAIKSWGLAAKVLAVAPNPANPRRPQTVPSILGSALLSDDGLDPYAEDPGTYWLLHWRMLAPPSALPVWWIIFNEFHGLEFTPEEIELFAAETVDGVSVWNQPAATSIKKDVLCLLRMYSSASDGPRTTADDLVDSPFSQLGLIRHSQVQRAFRLVIGRKPTLAPEIILYAVFDYLARTDSSARTATLSRLVSEQGAPGRAFMLSDIDTEELLSEALARYSDLVTVTSASGVSQIAFKGAPELIGSEILLRYFDASASREVDPAKPLCGSGSDAAITAAGELFSLAAVGSPTPVAESQPKRRRPRHPLEELRWHQEQLDGASAGGGE